MTTPQTTHNKLLIQQTIPLGQLTHTIKNHPNPQDKKILEEHASKHEQGTQVHKNYETLIDFDPQQNICRIRTYYKNGLMEETTYKNSKQHSYNNQPCRTYYRENGTLLSTEYKHPNPNPNHPTAYTYYPNGSLASAYNQNPTKNTTNTLIYHENNQLKKISQWKNGKITNYTQPAIIQYDKQGNITDQKYLIKSQHYTKQEWLKHPKVQKHLRKLKNKTNLNNNISL